MYTSKLSRRSAFNRAGLLVGAALAGETLGAIAAPVAQTAPKNSGPFRFCLNTATIRGQKLGIVKEIEIAAQAGYDAIEPWVESLDEYVKNGGKPRELRPDAYR